MLIRKYKNLIAFRESDHSPIWGFHSHNMEVAELTEPIWNTFLSSDSSSETEPNELFLELNEWNNEISQETKDAQDIHHIKKLSLNVVQICNLRCTYCAAGGDGTYGSATKKLDLSRAYRQISHFINQYSSNLPKQKESLSEEKQTFHIQFLGGEPLLHPHIIEKLCHYAQLCAAGLNVQMEFSITTNGTLITEQIANMFARYNFSVAISIDGDAQVNDVTRKALSQNKSSTELTLMGLTNLQKVRSQIRVLKVNSVFGSHNMAIHNTYQFLQSLNVDFDEINFLYANNENSELNEQLTNDYLLSMKSLAKVIYSKKGITGLAQIKQFQMVLSRLYAKTRIHSYCGAGKSLIQSDTNGDLYGCNWFMNDPKEKMGHDTNIIESKKIKLQPSLIKLNQCESCWAKHFCGGGCLYVHKSATGDKHKKDPMFCKRTRELGAVAINYFAAQNTTNDNYLNNKNEQKQLKGEL